MKRKFASRSVPKSRAFMPMPAALLVAVTGLGILVAPLANADEYILGAQDKLKIRVYEWRPVTGTAFEWVPLTGDFVISAAGNLSLPIIGTVPAAGLTLDEMADSIGERLKEQVGMQKRPNASVEVSEYRPFFISGLVAQPGKYSFVPGLTVIQALSMAGGTAGPIDANVLGVQHDVLTSRGDIRTLAMERYGLLARQARVDTILQNEDNITFPPELTARSTDPVVGRMMREEEDLFTTRKRSINGEIDSLNEARVLAANQIETLKSKATSLAKQIELASKDVGTVEKLVSAGLTVSARSLGANQNLSDLESRNLDVSLATLKAQQDVAKVDRDIVDARNRYRVEALTEAAELRDKLATNNEKAQTAHALLDNIAEHAPLAASIAISDGRRSFEISLQRSVDGIMRTFKVGDNDPVHPGDVIVVEKTPVVDATVPEQDLTSMRSLDKQFIAKQSSVE